MLALRQAQGRLTVGAFRRQRQQSGVGEHHHCSGSMAPGLIEDQDVMGTGRDLECDILEMHAHRAANAPGA